MLNLTLISGTYLLGAVEEAESNGIFSGTLGDSLWTIIWFIVLIFVLKRFAWRYILEGLKTREEHIAKEIDDAKKTHQDAQIKLKEYQDRILQVDQEGAEIAKKYMARAQNEARALVDKTQSENEATRKRAQQEIEYAKLKAKAELMGNIGDMVFGLSSEVLGRSVSNEDNKKLIDDAVATFKAKINE